MQYRGVNREVFLWVLQGICTLHRKPFPIALAQPQVATPYTIQSLIRAIDEHGSKAFLRKTKSKKFHKESFPAWLSPVANDDKGSNYDADRADAELSEQQTSLQEFPAGAPPALILQADDVNLLIVEPNDAAPSAISIAQFNQHNLGHFTRISPKADLATDINSEAEARQTRKFGFRWFISELLKHKKLWQEVLLASFVIQLIALAPSLFTQAILDQVVAHCTESTLIVIAIGMVVCMLFSAALSRLRQYLILVSGEATRFNRKIKIFRCVEIDSISIENCNHSAIKTYRTNT